MHCLGGSRWAKKLFLVSEYFAKGSLYGILFEIVFMFYYFFFIFGFILTVLDLLHKRKIRLSLDRILQIAIDTAEGYNIFYLFILCKYIRTYFL